MLKHVYTYSFFILSLVCCTNAYAERLKDMANFLGSRNNQIFGYGLVVGLQGTGDDFSTGIGEQSVITMLRRLGVNIESTNLHLRNVAAVMITADLPAFVAPGQRLDVVVSSVGSARSLEGGTLIASPLKGSDLKVYAVAQGPLSVGGFYAHAATARLTKNITTVGRIPSGAIVEREIPVNMPKDKITISLHHPDFTTAAHLAIEIDKKLKELVKNAPVIAAPPIATEKNADADENTETEEKKIVVNPNEPWATARDSGTLLVRIPAYYADHVPDLMAEIENIESKQDMITRVVINERTGTVVLGDTVRLSPVAIAHGGLTLEVKDQSLVSQPGPFSNGNTVVVTESTITSQEAHASLQALSPGASLGEVVKALNTLGVSPRDLLSILQALKASGALRAELEIQ